MLIAVCVLTETLTLYRLAALCRTTLTLSSSSIMSVNPAEPNVAHYQLVLARCERSIEAWLEMVVDCTLPTWYMKVYVHRMMKVRILLVLRRFIVDGHFL